MGNGVVMLTVVKVLIVRSYDWTAFMVAYPLKKNRIREFFKGNYK